MQNVTTEAATALPTPTVPHAAALTLDPELQERLAALEAERERRRVFQERVWRERRVLFPLLAIALMGFLNFGRARVVGRSMEPQYHDGDSLIMLKSFKYFSPLKPGDIVIIRMRSGRMEGQDIVKRVVYIQNQQGDAPWPKTVSTAIGNVPLRLFFGREMAGFVTVPRDTVMVLGDNVRNSTDSRDFGPVPVKDILGKVVGR